MSEHEKHNRFCTRPLAKGGYGDVRQCEQHGKIMLAYEAHGTVAPYWRTLSPIWTPVLYWRARRALANN